MASTACGVWAWTRNETPAQQWIFPDVFDALNRCIRAGNC